jgi:hypothetical protein
MYYNTVYCHHISIVALVAKRQADAANSIFFAQIGEVNSGFVTSWRKLCSASWRSGSILLSLLTFFFDPKIQNEIVIREMISETSHSSGTPAIL